MHKLFLISPEKRIDGRSVLFQFSRCKMVDDDFLNLQSLNSEQQIAIVSDVRQAMRHAANEIEGKEKILPGFCLRKVSTALFFQWRIFFYGKEL